MRNEYSLREISRSAGLASESRAGAARRAPPFPVGQATSAHLFVEASTTLFWKAVEDPSTLGFRGTEADNRLAHLSATYGERIQEFRDRMAAHSMQVAALYHVLPLNDALRRSANSEEGVRVGKFIHDVGGGILNLAALGVPLLQFGTDRHGSPLIAMLAWPDGRHLKSVIIRALCKSFG
jgi:hypothetical protein